MTGALPLRIGRYEIRREVGRGTMGVVYEAHDPDGGRVALKTIQLGFDLPPSADRTEIEERFLVEARVAARLSHPGIVRVHEAGRDAATGMLYIALEYLEGRTLEEVVARRQPLAWRRVLEIVRDLARALHHAHARRVIHRDVKPANVMVLPDGQPKIMDFGIAKIETLRLKLTREGQSMGTPLYMAPEQALARKVDGRADVFSVGAIAYVLLTGRDAFAAANLVKILVRVVHDDPPAPSSITAEVPPEVDALVARALAKDPSHRYPTAQALAEDAEDLLAGRPPRHRATWRPPAPARAPLPATPTPVEELEEQIRAQFEALDAETTARLIAADPVEEVAALVEEAPAEAPRGVREDTATLPPVARPGPPRDATRWLAALAAVALAILGARLLWLAGPSPAAGPSPVSPASPRPRNVTGPVGAPAPPTDAPAPAAPAQAAATAPVPGRDVARLVIDLEHPLRRGTVRVWVDDDLVLDAPLRAQEAKKIVAFTLRRGSLDRTVPLEAGPHAVRLTIAWDRETRTGTTTAVFEPGGERTLQVRLGRLRKNLSLDWKQP